jgi:hypothetical protein
MSREIRLFFFFCDISILLPIARFLAEFLRCYAEPWLVYQEICPELRGTV